jgi:twinkle protein
MINFESIQELKQAASLLDIVSSKIKLKKDGSNHSGLCPFHNEKSPSFKVKGDMYKCFGCGKSGDVFSFVMESENTTFFEAVKKVAASINFELKEDTTKYIKPVERLTKLNDKFLQHFESKRKISNNTLLRFGITESIEWMPKAKTEIPVICFNYYKDKELVNIKFRGANKDMKLAKDAELIFYNLDAIKDDKQCVIVEGEIDCLSMYEAGVYNCVSVPNGANVNGKVNLKYLDNCFDYFANKTKIIIATDNDAAGKKLSDELVRRFGKERCYKLEFPEDCKDANDILCKYGKEHLKSLTHNAKEFPIDGVHTMEEMEHDLNDYYLNGYPKGERFGLGSFDDLLQFTGGQFTTVTGIPNGGKSEWVDNIMAKSVISSGWKWAICSFENSPATFHVTKLMEKIVGKSFAFRQNLENRIAQWEFEQSKKIINDYFYFMNINALDVTLDGILEKALELIKRKGINGLLIDPWNYIEHKIPVGYTETQYISESLTKIKTFALQHQIHIFVVAHPTKMKKDDKGKFEIPNLYSISGSAHWFNKTDNGICVYRNFDTGIVDIYVQKVRFSWLGKVDFCSYTFNADTRQYLPII